MKSLLKKGLFCGALGISLSLGLQTTTPDIMVTNVAEARSDYYVGYDPYEGANMYIDRDSVRRTTLGIYTRASGATVHWSNGKSDPNYLAAKKDGVYYFSAGAGGLHPAQSIAWNFAYYCDLFAWGE